MSIRNCPECAEVSDDTRDRRGRCGQCHGTGFVPGLRELHLEDVAGESVPCRLCGGSGECPACRGSGYLGA